MFKKMFGKPAEVNDLDKVIEEQLPHIEERERKIKRWRADRVAKIAELHKAERAHKKAKTEYELFVDGPEKTVRAQIVNSLAAHLVRVKEEFADINTFEDWIRRDERGGR